MASSKKPRPATEPSSTTSHNSFDLLVAAVQQTLNRTAKLERQLCVAVAYSGGADSTALLHAVATLHQRGLLRAIALHVHHGLSPHADAWLEHCTRVAASLELPFYAERVQLHLTGGQSIEAEARQARYATLQTLCETHQAEALLTAHHADDQAETVLLNLLRGTGVAGLAGAAAQRALGDLTLLRPFLGINASTLRQLAIAHNWPFIEDESNLDKRHTRNALRHEVMPVLKRIFPATNARLAQTAAHLAEAQALLDDIGLDDLAQINKLNHPISHKLNQHEESDLDIEGLRQLSRPRAANALRVWFRARSRYVPATLALEQMLDQLLESRSDAQISLIHDDLRLQVYRGRIYTRPVSAPAVEALQQSIHWNGEAELPLPNWHGTLVFTSEVSDGIPASVLRNQVLSLRSRQGGERLKLHAQRPSRSLKNLYQESGIPPWQRAQLPLLYAGEQLLFAAGLGMDVRLLQEHARSNVDADVDNPAPPLIALSWRA